MTDTYRALCAEPEPATEESSATQPTNGEVAELVAELNDAVDGAMEMGWETGGFAMRRAAELLERLAPQPVPEGPSDEELDELAWNWFSKTGSTWWQIEGFRAFARAVLARWGTPNNTINQEG